MASGSRNSESPSFDRVVFVSDDGPLEFSREEFMALPLDQRIHHILAGSLRFYLGEKEVSTTEAVTLG